MNNLMLFSFLSFLMLFFLNFHPFYLSICLLSMSISLMSLMNFFYLHWMNMIIILVYLGGLLILFIYVSSLVPMMKYFIYFYGLEFFIFWIFSKNWMFMSNENMFSFDMNMIFFFSEKSILVIFFFLMMFIFALMLTGKFLKLMNSPLRIL